MGAYLSEPVTVKQSEDYELGMLIAGASAMQGWRVSQEDAHNCVLNFDEEGSALFAVYDGHGGHEVAAYAAKHLPDFIKSVETYKLGNLAVALEDAFLGFDEKLTHVDVIDKLKEIAGTKDDATEQETAEEVSELYEEAAIPLPELIAKYRKVVNPNILNLKGNSKPLSPFLRAKRDSGLSKEPVDEKKKLCIEDGGESGDDAEASPSVPNSSKDKSDDAGGGPAVETGEEPTSDAKVEVDSDETKVNSVVVNGAAPSPGGDAKTEAVAPGEDINGEVTDHTKQTAQTVVTAKGKGKGKGKSKMSDAITAAPEEEDVSINSTETEKKVKPSPQDIYRGIFENEEKSDSDESDENFDVENDEVDVEEGEEEQEDEEEEDDDDDEVDEDEDAEDDEDNEEFTMNMKEEPGSDSGCTAVLALQRGNSLYVANAGDSRCVICRNGKAVDLSIDHKPEDPEELSRIICAGGKVTEGRVNGGLNLSRALGDHAYKQNSDLGPRDQMITSLPDVCTFTLKADTDTFMVLACDGIWNFMNSQEVIDFVEERIDKQDKMSTICEELFDNCLAPNTHGDGTGCDNMTAIIVKFNWSETSDMKEEESSPKVSIKRPAEDDVEPSEDKRPKLDVAADSSS